MRKIAFALAAAAALGLAAPAYAGGGHIKVAQATVVKPADRTVVQKVVRHHSAARRHHGCKTVIVKKHRGHRIIVTKVRRCR